MLRHSSGFHLVAGGEGRISFHHYSSINQLLQIRYSMTMFVNKTNIVSTGNQNISCQLNSGITCFMLLVTNGAVTSSGGDNVGWGLKNTEICE